MAEYIDREKVLEEINKLKLSTWFNKGKNEIADYQHCMYLERKESVETVTDLCVKQQPPADVVERSKIDAAIEKIKKRNEELWYCDTSHPKYEYTVGEILTDAFKILRDCFEVTE